MSTPLDDYDGLEDSRRGYELWCNLKRAELRECAVEAAIERLRAALRKHGRPNQVVTHPEIDAAFSALVMTGPVRISEVRR